MGWGDDSLWPIKLFCIRRKQIYGEKPYLLGGQRMESCMRYAVVILAVLICPVIAAEKPFGAASNKPVAPAAGNVSTVEVNDANLPALPFMAEIISDDVYIRSGPGTNYYYCGKLKNGDKIKVVGSRFSWLQIAPPTGSYSWISKQYVQIDPQNSANGTVIGEAVRVYAGSDDVAPMHSTTMQLKLNKGDKVAIIGEEKDSYCKISPPEGAYLWVSNQYVKPLGTLMPPPPQPMPTAPAIAMPATPPGPVAPFPTPPAGSNKAQVSSPNESNMQRPATAAPADGQKMEEFMALKTRVDAEKAKPAEQQNFTDLKKEAAVMAGDKSFRVASNAKGLLKNIERYELAMEVAKAAKVQEEQFGQITQRIETARNEKIAQLEDLSIFAVIGQLKETTLFATTPGEKYFRVTDSEGKTLCYARPIGTALDMDLSKFIDKKVGLVGTIEAQAELGEALVQFTNVVELP
jgi:uncharacterized protein YgiM (DUF1202 family)